ncbi:MAG: efflux RND transporter periplasmic adaptor subunit [Peptococcaceae bacterium]|nr:efflux RND transporter periplasmic adaptor subunit [Peptococcaceae bacterium]
MDLKTEALEFRGKRRRWVLPVIVVAVLVLLVLLILARISSRKADNAATQERLQPVEVVSVMSRPFSDELSVSGLVTPFMEANLSPLVAGRVSAVNVEVGQRVKQGETLLIIDQTDYFAALKQAEAGLESARANSIQAGTAYENAKLNYQRQEDLFKQGAVSQSQLEAARGQLAAAESAYKANQAQIVQYQAMLDKARADYNNTRLRAPFPGVVARRLVDPGEMVSQQTPVFTLIQDEPLLVKVNLPENTVARVAPGQQVDIYVAATGKTYKGTVATVAPQADQQTRAFASEIKLADTGREVKPGMVADLIIKVKEIESTLVVPTEALLDEEGGAGAFVVENGIARHRKVTTGLVGQGYTQVLSGLQQGEVVVVRGNHLLVDGMKVRVEGTIKESAPQSGGESN